MNVMRSLVLLTVLSAGVACVGDGATFIRERQVIAVVSGAPIYLDEFRRELSRIALDNKDGVPSLDGARAQRQALLNDLIDRRLLLRQAEKHNVVVGMDEVEAAFKNTQRGWRTKDDGTCPECVFEYALRAKDFTAAELKRELREQLLIQKYFASHVFSRVAVTDRDIETYLEQHLEIRTLPEQVRALQIVVKTAEQARLISREIRKGLSFEDAAMKYSLSPEGKRGGDLGFFERGVMPSVFDEACFSLRVGQMSKVVASDYGFHLFKIVDHRPQTERTVTQLREVIERILRSDKERIAQAARLEALHKEASIEIREHALAKL